MRVLDIDSQPLNTSEPSAHAGFANGNSFHEPKKYQQWRPSKKAIIGSAVGLVVVSALVFGLVFGLNNEEGGTASATVSNLPSSCKEIGAGNLTDFLKPFRYDVTVNIETEHFAFVANSTAVPNFEGSTDIAFNVTEATSCVVLHGANLTFTSISVVPEPGSEPVVLCDSTDSCAEVVSKVEKDPVLSSADQDLVAIDMSGGDVTFEADSSPVMKFTYSAPVGANPGTYGVQRSAPYSPCGTDGLCMPKYLIGTQLERLGARLMFPSYDMPSAKAIFVLTVRAPSADAKVILSNTEEDSSVEDGDYVVKTFKQTPLMSTYLLAFVAGQLEQAKGVQASAGSKYQVKAWAVPGFAERMTEAGNLGYKALDYFDNYITSVSQPVTTYDFVAFPGKQNAMENWGLIIFDEARVFYDNSTSGTYDRVRLASVVCHEVGHQWFGNIVTCATWDQLAIQEGMTSSEEYACMEAISPDLPADVLRYRIIVPGGDSPAAHDGPLYTAQVLAQDPLAPGAIPANDLNMNDPTLERIVYAKGAVTFLMMRYAMDALMIPLGYFWKDSINQYIKDKAFSTAIYSDIFKSSLEVVKPIYDAQVGPDKAIESIPWANGFINRTNQLLAAGQNPQMERIFTANNSAPLGGFGYTPSYPFFDTTRPNLINPNSYPETLVNIGTNQTRYCAWNMTDDDVNAYDIPSSVVDRMRKACTGPGKFVNVIVMHNMTDCPANKTASYSLVSGPINYGSVAEDRWVLNKDAVRLWRTKYSDVHFNNLVEEAQGMPACPAEVDTTNVTWNGGASGYCCAAAAELLATTGVMNDALQFAIDGTYPASWVMKMAAATASSPVADTGLGVYLLVLPAVEAVEALRGYVADDDACVNKLNAFQISIMEPHVGHLLADVKGSANGTMQSDSKKENTLARMAASPLLRFAALTPEPMEDNEQGDGRKLRRLLQQQNEAAQAPAGAADDGEPDAGADPPAADEEAYYEEDPTQDYPEEDYPQDYPDEGEYAPAGAPAVGPARAAAAKAPGPAAVAADEKDTADAPAPAEMPDMPAMPAAAPETFEELAMNVTEEEGNPSVQEQLCAMLPSTPLWHNYIANEITGKPTAVTDLLAAIYHVAAAMPDKCRATLEAQYATTDLAKDTTAPGLDDVETGIRYALTQCYLYDSTITESYRCVNALARTENPTVLFNVTDNPQRLNPQDRLTAGQRKVLLTSWFQPWLLANMMKASPSAWVKVAEGLATGDLWNQMNPGAACAVLGFMNTPPQNAQQFDLIESFLATRASQCPPDLRTRMIGRMLLAKRNADNIKNDICAFLDSWQAGR